MSAGKKNALCAVFLLALIGAGMFLLNVHTPLMMDDYDYSFSWYTGERLAGISDILASQVVHYQIWGGRSVVHFFAQLFLYLGKPFFNAANALMYLLLLMEIVYLGAKRKVRWDWRFVLIAHVLLFFATPFFGVVFLWLDGACNYLWGTVLALVPLLIAKSEREAGFFDAGVSRGWLALPLCFLAGWTNENTACGVLAACFLLMLWDACRGRKVRAWRIAAFAAQMLGVAVMLLAPGNYARPSDPGGRGLVMELIYRVVVVSYCALRYAGIPALAALVLFAAVYRRRKPITALWFSVLCICAFFSAYALVGSPQISDRAFTGVLALSIAALLSACEDMMYDMMYKRKRDTATGIVLTLLVISGMSSALSDVRAHELAWRAQEDKILAAIAAGETRVAVSAVPSDSRYTMSITLEQEADQWPNSTLSKYYGIEVSGL